MTEQRPATGMRSQLQELIADLTAERDQLREQLKEERLTSEDEARKRDEHFAENKQLRTALREMREALKVYSADCGVCHATAVLAKYAKLAEGGNGGEM